jgi:hypothetical protein
MWLTAVASRSICFIDKDSAEHVTTIFGRAWPSSTACVFLELFEHVVHVIGQHAPRNGLLFARSCLAPEVEESDDNPEVTRKGR